MTRYLICSTPRTGSNLLCDYIIHTGDLGMSSLETCGLFIGYGESVKENPSGKFEDYFNNAQTPNGVQGTKAMYDYFDHLQERCGIGVVVQMMQTFTHFITLRRSDVVAQAVSLQMARTTGIWTSEDAKRKEAHTPHYDYNEITWRIAMIEGMNARFDSWFSWAGIDPLIIYYEQVVEQPQMVLEAIYKHLGLDIPVHIPVKHILQKQTSPIKDEWITRYHADHDLQSVSYITY